MYRRDGGGESREGVVEVEEGDKGVGAGRAVQKYITFVLILARIDEAGAGRAI